VVGVGRGEEGKRRGERGREKRGEESRERTPSPFPHSKEQYEGRLFDRTLPVL
jgi:hypothetical protein